MKSQQCLLLLNVNILQNKSDSETTGKRFEVNLQKSVYSLMPESLLGVRSLSNTACNNIENHDFCHECIQ